MRPTNALTVADAFFREASLARDLALVVGFSILTALCAQIAFYIGPVPITGQTLAVLLAGAVLGSRRGALSQLTYLAVGATGVPFWFAPGPTLGIARILGPTGGYLIGFIAAAFVVGLLAERGWDRRLWKAAVAFICGNVAIYLFGLSWLALYLSGDALLAMGLYPFIPGDLFKVLLATLALPGAWTLLSRRQA